MKLRWVASITTRVPLPTHTHEKMSQIFRYTFTWHAELADREKLQNVLEVYCTKFIYQLEKGKESGRLHFQGRCTLKDKTRLVTLAKKWQPELPGIHLSPEVDEQGSTRYSGKCETRIEGPWAFPREIAHPPKKYLTYDQLWDWQRRIVDLVKQPCEENRYIRWFYDDKGCSGKSVLTDYITKYHGAEDFSWNDTRHILYAVVEAGPKPCYIFDMTRSKPKESGLDDIFSALESIKNGRVRSSMYKNQKMEMAPPHVLVFANFAPPKEKLSNDRLKIYQVPPPPSSFTLPQDTFQWSDSCAAAGPTVAGLLPSAAAPSAAPGPSVVLSDE